MKEDIEYEDVSDAEVVSGFHMGLCHTREHLLLALRHAYPGGSHGEMCYNLHAGVTFLMAIFDGIAMFVETRVAQPPARHLMLWENEEMTFLDPRFAALRAIQVRTNDRIILHGCAIRREIATIFAPWQVCAEEMDDVWDVHLSSGSRPLMRDLVFPLFNDALEALTVLYGLLGLEGDTIHAL